MGFFRDLKNRSRQQVMSSTPSFAAGAYRPDYAAASGFKNPERLADRLFDRKIRSLREKEQTPASNPVGTVFDRRDVAGSLASGAIPTRQDILRIYTPFMFGMPETGARSFENARLLESAGYPLMVGDKKLELPSVFTDRLGRQYGNTTRPVTTRKASDVQSARERMSPPLPRAPLPMPIPERMPSPRPTPRFFGGGLRSIFAGLPQQMPMPMEEMPLGRPGFAEGEDVDINRILETQRLRDEMLNTKSGFFESEEPFNTMNISDTNMLIADQGAREGISPAERKAQSIKNFLLESGRIISDRDADLYGMGVLSFEDVMRKAESARQTNLANEQQQNAIVDQGRTISNMDRNLMQQEQMFFPQSESLDDILADLEKKN